MSELEVSKIAEEANALLLVAEVLAQVVHRGSYPACCPGLVLRGVPGR